MTEPEPRPQPRRILIALKVFALGIALTGCHFAFGLTLLVLWVLLGQHGYPPLHRLFTFTLPLLAPHTSWDAVLPWFSDFRLVFLPPNVPLLVNSIVWGFLLALAYSVYRTKRPNARVKTSFWLPALMLTAACFEHKHHIGYSVDRMAAFEDELVAVLNSASSAVFAWNVLPNHYHALVDTPSIKSLIQKLGQFHGLTSPTYVP